MPDATPDTFNLLPVLQEIMEHMSGGCFTCDGQARFTYLNPAAERILGVRRDEVLGRSQWEVFPEALGTPVEDEYRRAAAGEVRDFENCYAPWGRWFHLRCFPLVAGGFGVYFEDVSEQHRAEQALHESEQRYRELVESANSAIIRWTRDGTVTFVNDYAQRLFGWSADELVGHRVSSLLPGGATADDDQSSLAEEILARPDRYVNNVNQNARKDGSLLWVAWTNRVLLDEQGEVGEVLAIGNDVTALVAAQAGQRESQERLTLALSAGGIATWDYQIESGRVSWNDEHFRMLGYDVGEVEPSFDAFHARVHPEDARAVADAFFGSLERAGDYQAQFRALLPDGGMRWIDAYGHLVLAADGSPQRSYGVMLDVTERRRAEQLLLERGAEKAAHAERNRLARDLHDSVTQALFAASLKAEALMLSADTFSPESARTIEEFRRLSRGALAQMRTMLLELRSEPLEDVPLRQLLRNLVEAAESRASIDVGLAVHGEGQPPAEVHVALYRIAEEALNNVARHSRARRAWVELDLAPGSVRLTVGDDGQGFDQSAADPSHMGLKSMRERAEEVGAEFSVLTGAAEGTIVVVVWRAADARPPGSVALEVAPPAE